MGYYVMHEVDGDEIVLFSRDTIEAAESAMRAFAAKAPARAALSVWDSRGGIVLEHRTAAEIRG